MSLAPDAPPSAVPGLRWQARVLAPWMTDPDARLIMAAGETERPLTAVQEAWLERARAAVAARPAGVAQDDLIRPLPPEMSGYLARMGRHPESQWYLSQGFTPAMVDLRRTCAYQSKIYTEHAGQHVADVDVEDVTAMAEVTMPLGTPPVVAPRFDAERQTFVTDLANHNLRIIGAFGGLAEDAPQPGTYNLGFQVRVIASFVQVVSVQGRWFIRDGYHRSVGLLQRGARYVPVLVKEELGLGDLAVPGMLPFESYLGERPPLLPDFLDSGVSCAVALTAARRVVVVQASEVSISG
ncbi:MAG TPA: hypothetical protein VGM79_05760 [Streptosporangiaceae bacterium]|jgi:hypothetical protein